MIKLVAPNKSYKKSFIEALKEFHQEGRNKSYKVSKLEEDFAKFVKSLLAKEKGIGLKKGYVPESVLWLVTGSKFIGKASIRHRLTESLLKNGGHIGYEIRPSERKKGYGKIILKLTLEEAKKLGIKKALLTCYDDNIGSFKIIEANGGIEDKIEDFEGKLMRYYWIEIK